MEGRGTHLIVKRKILLTIKRGGCLLTLILTVSEPIWKSVINGLRY